MGRRPKETLLQRRNTDSQQAHEKMLNTDNYWKSLSRVRLFATPWREIQIKTAYASMAIIKKSVKKQMLERVGEGGFLPTLLYMRVC